jgi:prophage regulatory protein
MRFLRLPEVQRLVPFSRSTIYRKIAAGEFPRPYDLGADPSRVSSTAGRTVAAWLESEVEEWIRARVAARESQCLGGPES